MVSLKKGMNVTYWSLKMKIWQHFEKKYFLQKIVFVLNIPIHCIITCAHEVAISSIVICYYDSLLFSSHVEADILIISQADTFPVVKAHCYFSFIWKKNKIMLYILVLNSFW